MENTAAQPEPIVLNQPNPQIVPKKKKNPIIIFVLIVTAIVILILAGFAGFLFLNKTKPQATKVEQKESSQSATPSSTPTASVGYVNAAEGLNLRELPTTDSNVILLLPFGTTVQILGTDNDWYYVQAQTKGYVAKSYITTQKPEKGVLKVFADPASPFNFLYHDVYKVTFSSPAANTYEYNFVSSDSFGGFSVTSEAGHISIGNYALQNYPGSSPKACQVQIATARKECEQIETDNGTLYLLLINTTLYKISYLKTEGGALADINNIVFFSLYLNTQS